MSPSVDTPSITADAAQLDIARDPPAGRGTEKDESEVNHRFWTRVVFFTAVAGGVYGGMVVPIAGFLIGFPWALVMAVYMALPFVLAVRTLSGRWRHPWAGPAFGGTVGFVSTFPVWSELNLWVFALAPMATTFLGQVGGYLAVRPYWQELRTEPPWRFSVRTMLVATCWAALLLGLLRGLGMLQPARAQVLLWWLPWQAVLCMAFIRAGHGRANRLGIDQDDRLPPSGKLRFT